MRSNFDRPMLVVCWFSLWCCLRHQGMPAQVAIGFDLLAGALAFMFAVIGAHKIALMLESRSS